MAAIRVCWLGDPKQRKAHGGSSNSSQNLTCGIVQKTRAQEENGIKISSHQYSANPNDRQTITGKGVNFLHPVDSRSTRTLSGQSRTLQKRERLWVVCPAQKNRDDGGEMHPQKNRDPSRSERENRQCVLLTL